MNFGRSAAKGHHCHDERKECASNLTTISRPKMHPQLEANECQGSKQRDPWYLVDFPSFKECVWCDSMIDAPTVPHLHHWWHLSMHYSSKQDTGRSFHSLSTSPPSVTCDSTSPNTLSFIYTMHSFSYVWNENESKTKFGCSRPVLWWWPMHALLNCLHMCHVQYMILVTILYSCALDLLHS